MKRTQWLIVLAALAIGVGCGDDDVMTPDSGMGDAGRDAGRDAGMTDGGSDAGMDATVDVDAGTDGGVDDDGGMDDGGMDDAGTDGGTDAGMMMVGGGAATSAEITTVLAAADDAVTLMINDAVVTYVKPAIDDMEDGAGFFLQAEQTGPALYVGVDPSTLTPAPEVGDVVSLRVTNLATSGGGLRYATSVDMFAVGSSDHSVDFLVQEVSAVDLVTNLDQYPAELISLVGTIETEFAGAGTGFSAAQITTAGVATATSSLRFRIPQSVLSTLTIGTGCDIDLGPTPLWRFTTTAQPSAWAAADVTVDCPAPGAGELVVSEVGYLFAGSDDDLEFVELHNPSTAAFDLGGCILSDSNGPADADALTLPADSTIAPGGYFVIAGSASEITGDVVLPSALGFGGSDSVTLTCGGTTVDTVDWTTMSFGSADDVSMQLSPTQLDATANDTLTNWCPTLASETYGTMGRRGTPGAANVSCVVPAVVRINEVNAHIDGGCDLVELRVVSGGSMGGFRFQERGSSIYTFAEGFTVAANDIVVIHMDSGDTNCTGGVAGPMDETTSIAQVPAATVSTNYDTAYDVYSTDTGLTDTDNVFGLIDAAGAFVDVVFVADDPTGSAAGASETAAASAAAAGQWTTPAGAVPAGGFIDDEFCANAVQDSNATGNLASGESLQRNDDADTNHTGGWTQAANSWGVLNAGQTAF